MENKNMAPQGLQVHCRTPQEADAVTQLLETHDLREAVELTTAAADTACLRLRPETFCAWTPDFDTLDLNVTLGLNSAASDAGLLRETLIALLASPVPLVFPSVAELAAALRIRRNIVRAGQRTALAFHTEEAERPADCWTYDETRGFTIWPACSLIDALRKATQPELTGHVYAFSCYRATEYVILLGIAEELASSNPALYARLEQRCQTRAIRSAEFHEVLLREYGCQEQPIPARYYVPGDRVWFRNPDDRSSDVAGYEGSWVMYLGAGLFTNFWKRDQPYSLDAKCLEIYHWRDGLYRDVAGEPAMDENIVERQVAATLAQPAETERILARMQRMRDPSGHYGDGGCIDTTRESPRWVCPGTSDIDFPAG